MPSNVHHILGAKRLKIYGVKPITKTVMRGQDVSLNKSKSIVRGQQQPTAYMQP